MEDAEADLLAFYGFPAEHWSKLRSTNPLERVNREIGRRTDVVGIFPNDAALLRLAGMLLLEQNDEWLVGRRYLSESSMALVLAAGHPTSPTPRPGTQEVPQLTASLTQTCPTDDHQLHHNCDLTSTRGRTTRRRTAPRPHAQHQQFGVLCSAHSAKSASQRTIWQNIR